MGFGIQSTKKKMVRSMQSVQIPKHVERVESVQNIQSVPIAKPVERVESVQNIQSVPKVEQSSSSILIIHSKKPVKNRLTIGVTAGTSVRKNKTVISSPVETENINTRATPIPTPVSKPKVEYTITKNIRKPEKVKIIEQDVEEDIETIEIPVIEKIIVK
jgi:hypothetical protein